MASIQNRSIGRKRMPLMSAMVIVIAIFNAARQSPLVAQQPPASGEQAAGEVFPDGITPSNVFASLNLVDRCLDRLIAEKNITPPVLPPRMESELGPLHAHQLILACSHRVQELGDQAGVLAVPTLSAKPRLYTPRDVLFVVGLIFDGLNRIAAKAEIEDLPRDEITITGKTPTDVFDLAAAVFLKVGALCGHEDISPSEVYAEMVRAAEDARSVLRQADPESRYRVDAPPSEPGRVPGDVFKKCLDIRRLLNQHRMSAGQPEVALATPPRDYEIRPRDVFFQTQIIIAELNLLKLRTDTISSTPLAIPVKSTKDPTAVHEQASLIEYLLRQVKAGTDRSEE